MDPSSGGIRRVLDYPEPVTLTPSVSLDHIASMLYFEVSVSPYFVLATGCPPGEGWVGSWCPGIGDPTIVGWFTVVAYAVCALLCYLNLRAPSLRTTPHAALERGVWILLLVSFALLGLNKQLDLQSAMTEALRQLAQDRGWYERRHEYQRLFIETVGLATLLAAAAVIRITWPLPGSVKAAGVGLCLVLGYVLIRAVSFHYMDALIGMSILTVRVNWLLELTGLFIAAGAALKRYRLLSKTPKISHKSAKSAVPS